MKLGFIAPVNGISYRQKAARTVTAGDVVRFEHQPTNPADVNAVAVTTRDGTVLGFLPRPVSERLLTAFGPGLVMHGHVTDVLTRNNNIGLRVRADGFGEPPAGNTEPDPVEPGDIQWAVAGSGRVLGQVTSRDDRNVTVTGADGQTRRYPLAAVNITSSDMDGHAS